MQFQTVSDVLAFFDQFTTTPIDLSLNRMERALALLGNPQRTYPTIHIGGTNGKGSTTSFLRNILQAHGYRVATFTSPHIEVFNERMQINGVNVSDADLLATTNNVFATLGECVEALGLTQFELMTLVMFSYFADQHPDFALIEVGMGGRFDATNVITPLMSILTNVSLDHQAFLGNTIELIATEKAGIIKPGVPLVTTSKDESVLAIFQAQAQQVDAQLYRLGNEFHVSECHIQELTTQFTYEFGNEFGVQVNLSLPGLHQVDNASAALSAYYLLTQLGHVTCDIPTIQAALQTTTWIGRMEHVSTQPDVFLDGAHNEAGIETLIQSLQAYFPNRTCHIIFCAMADKDVATMLPKLERAATRVHLTSFPFARAALATELVAFASTATTTANDDFAQTYQHVVQAADENAVILITGSLYFIAYVRKQLKFS